MLYLGMNDANVFASLLLQYEVHSWSNIRLTASTHNNNRATNRSIDISLFHWLVYINTHPYRVNLSPETEEPLHKNHGRVCYLHTAVQPV